MSKDVSEAFDILVERLKHSEAETATASAHRQSIITRLQQDFNLTSMFRSGSYGHGTSLSGISDIDYFAVIPAANLNNDSATTLRRVRESMESRFPSSMVYVDSPAVAVVFAGDSQRHEIIPARANGVKNGYNVYAIPNRAGGWMDSSPSAHNGWVNAQNDRLNKKLKHLIRLVKYWNYVRDVGLRSFYIELRVTEYITNEKTIIYSIDMYHVFRHLASKGLAAMQDPQGVSGYVYPCTDAVKDAALSKVNTALTRAAKAREEEMAGRIQSAYSWWDMVFNDKFPGYY